MITMITLTQNEYEKLVAHARACLPEEACGLIGGTIDKDGKSISKRYISWKT